MKIAVPRELRENERRVALVPESCKKLTKAGIEIAIERGAGEQAYISDEAYAEAGATLEADVVSLLGGADFVLKVGVPTENPAAGKHEIDLLREGTMLLTTLLPAKNTDAVQRLAQRKISAFSTDAIPRTTRAQSMDTLSSMANIAGYKAVLIAADQLAKYFPMFMTAAGTIFSARVFIIGAGVAGLQAIATAKRLGATVTATDTRKVVGEQVESLGGKFATVGSDEDAQTASGYAKELSQDFYQKQAELIAQQCAANDVVITTALIGGVKAPKLITEEMVKSMQPGSVIVDLAAEAGGQLRAHRAGPDHRGSRRQDLRPAQPALRDAVARQHVVLSKPDHVRTRVLEGWGIQSRSGRRDHQRRVDHSRRTGGPRGDQEATGRR